jgi:hypothetical protein
MHDSNVIMLPLGQSALQVAVQIAFRRLRDINARLEAADKIMAEQNRMLAKAHAALQLAFEHMTTSSRVVSLKQVNDVLAELEGRRLP